MWLPNVVGYVVYGFDANVGDIHEISGGRQKSP